MFKELKDTWNILNEELKRPFYSDREAFHDRHKNYSQISKESELEQSFISYNPFGLYTTNYLGAQNSGVITYGDLVKKWRDVSQYPEVDDALNEIISEAIVFDEIDQPISINLDDLELTENIKQRIQDSFDNILYLLDFNEKGDELFRQWYIDATLNFEVVYNNRKLKDGIQKLILLPPFDLQKFKNEKTSEVRWYLNKQQTYNPIRDLENAEITYYDEQITQITSGILSPDKKMSFSPLQKAMKAINQLYTIEDSMIIMRLTKSTEKRAFYIDTGNLPKSKAEEYIKGLINKYRQKKVYNTETGTIENSQKSISLLEDFWFPVNACLDLKTKIKLLDGRDLELEKIIDEYNSGKQLWTYSSSPEGVIVPGKISWAGITRKNTEVIKVILDNDEEIICTPDHKFFLQNGIEKEAQYLTPNDSLISMQKDRISSLTAIKSVIKLDYTIDTGTLRIDDNHEIHNYHNFALAAGIFVMNSGRGTKVENLPGISQNFTAFDDVDYFLNKVYNALNIPNNRRNKENRVTINATLDIEKDELRFFKMVQKLRRKFNNLFVDLLKKDLIAKQVMSLDDWKKIQEKIKFTYATSNEISMIKKAQINQIKIDGANAAVGLATPELRIISPRYIQENIMRLTEEDINQINNDWAAFGGQGTPDALGNMPTGGEGGGMPSAVPGYSEVGGAGAGVGTEPPPPAGGPPTETPETPAGGSRFVQKQRESSLNQDILDQLEDGDIVTDGKNKLIYENGKLRKL